MRCGVLALQGDWAAHLRALCRLDVQAFAVRTLAELATADALVLPGGESTAMLRLMELEGLGDAVEQRLRNGMPALATCAGVILLAVRVRPAQRSFGVLDVDVERNAYGRQLHSVVTPIEVSPELGGDQYADGVFIRAPRVTRIGRRVRVLGRRGADPVLLWQDRIVAATFHPELRDDLRVHRLLVRLATEACDA